MQEPASLIVVFEGQLPNFESCCGWAVVDSSGEGKSSCKGIKRYAGRDMEGPEQSVGGVSTVHKTSLQHFWLAVWLN